MGCDPWVYAALTLISLGLMISVCLNIVLYRLKPRNSQGEVLGEFMYPEAYHMERHEDEEGQGHQENPIYGNINPDRTGAEGIGGGEDVFYEHMNTRSREEKPPQQDVAYASLDLTVGQKRRKKNRKKQNPKGQNRVGQSSQHEFLEVQSALPSRTSSPMMSRNSIYLNSQQVALETELGWEREMEDHMDSEAVHDDPTRFLCRANQSQVFESDSA
ncbi:hypothetical protein AAFF_G00371630 [Aldrovandia affinis]|uniref:T-cell receptor-associated transmembrane adapter 1 n=1 Tax=Aldrovandia affinis TaxID=143900 RepID=A0AAD7WML0_9TELE|nr:hypothetical protein AAFF_G00371630 [Aldrovandia affinis]